MASYSSRGSGVDSPSSRFTIHDRFVTSAKHEFFADPTRCIKDHRASMRYGGRDLGGFN